MSIAKDLAYRWTDMVLLKSEAYHMSIEGLKLNSKIDRGRLSLHHPSQVLLEASRGVSKHTKLKWKIWRKKYFYHEMNENRDTDEQIVKQIVNTNCHQLKECMQKSTNEQIPWKLEQLQH